MRIFIGLLFFVSGIHFFVNYSAADMPVVASVVMVLIGLIILIPSHVLWGMVGSLFAGVVSVIASVLAGVWAALPAKLQLAIFLSVAASVGFAYFFVPLPV